MQRLASEGIAIYSQWQEKHNVFFNSTFIAHDDGNILVDPLPLSEADAREIAERGGLRHVVVTNENHTRASADVARAFDAKIVAGLRGGEALAEGIAVIGFEGLMCAQEFGLHLPERRTAIVGDALWGEPAGAVRLLRDDRLTDPAAAVRSIQRLWSLELNVLIMGDGAPILREADRVIGEYLQSRTDIYVNRINLDEVVLEPFDDGNDYAAAMGEVGGLIGARHLGYRLVTLPPGKRFCPLHAHEAEEELYLVLDGAPTIRTPRGSIACRKGDVIAFPVGEAGAHQLVNTSDAPCTVFMLGEDDQNEVVFYPDSNKLLARSRRLLVRGSPNLDYYEGE